MAATVYDSLNPSDMPGVIKDLAEAVNAAAGAYTAVANAAGQTLTAAAVVNGVILRSGAAAVSDTTPTAALILAAMKNPAVGDTFECTIVNTNSGTLTIVAGSGITLAGTTTIATTKTRRYQGRVTNIDDAAVTLLGVSVTDN